MGQLEGMSIYASDFQELLRQHFNQILRIRRTVPKKAVPRHELSVHIDPQSITIHERAHHGKNFGVSFTVDAIVPCSVTLYWGASVSACNEFVQRRKHDQVEWKSSSRGSFSPPKSASGDTASGMRWPLSPASPQRGSGNLLELEEIQVGYMPSAGASASSAKSPAIFAHGQYYLKSDEFLLPA